MAAVRSVEFTHEALRTLSRVAEVSGLLARNAEIGTVVAGNPHVRMALLCGFQITYVIEELEVLVLTAFPA